MKRKLFLLGFAMLITIAPALAGIVIKTTVSIGRKSRDCYGFGFCIITSSSSYADGAINGTIDVNEERGSMIISINESDIQKVQPDKMMYFSNKSTVIFAEDYALTEDLNRALQAKKPILIKKGSYDLSYSNGKFFIEIPL
ncbi:MAG: hypothetical protein IPH20_04265 [Bacteroidales bacterium]|nr:hypothetical protein [Bacteroidales bacterium]